MALIDDQIQWQQLKQARMYALKWVGTPYISFLFQVFKAFSYSTKMHYMPQNCVEDDDQGSKAIVQVLARAWVLRILFRLGLDSNNLSS